jgi:lipoprotein LprG
MSPSVIPPDPLQPTRRVRRLLPLLCALAMLCALAGCTGGQPQESAAALGDRLRSAKQALDDAASLNLTLRADRLPPGVSGISEATGVATHAPAFDGTITIAGSGLFDGQRVEVVAVGGDVYAQTPFSSAFITVDPADFNAPDPARLMDPNTGLSTLLTSADDLAAAGEERATDQVLTAITGRVPGSTVARIFPSASAQRPFDATFWLDGDDRLRRAEVTGPFYGEGPALTYDITVQASDRRVRITAP